MATTSNVLHRRPGLRLGLLLTPPMLWLGVAYLGALATLLVTSLWSQNDFTGDIVMTDGRPSAKIGRRYRSNERLELVS